MRISVMQPYFLPYAGYFRLMCDVDVFVVLDNVQFPRGGWVHRNRLGRSDGRLGWLTLPLCKQPLATTIQQTRLRGDALTREWAGRVNAFPAGRWALDPSRPVGDLLCLESDLLALTLRRSLALCATLLGLTVPFVSASELGCDPALTGSDRILAICRLLGATGYLNLPGGRKLYDAQEFQRSGIALEFLPDYQGDMASILQRLYEAPADAVLREIRGNMPGGAPAKSASRRSSAFTCPQRAP